MASNQKFFQIIPPGTNYDFIGKRRFWGGISVLAVLASLLMLPLNAFVLKGRGNMLNWGVDFRGGSELVVEFSRTVDAGDIRQALSTGGFHGAEVVRSGTTEENRYMIRMGAISAFSPEQQEKLRGSLAKVGEASLQRVDWSEGSDKIYLRFDRALEPTEVTAALAKAGVTSTQIQNFGPPTDFAFEVTLGGLDKEVQAALEAKLGQGAVKNIPQVASVGPKAGQQLRDDGLKAMIGAILLIVVYIAFRFDFRYGPSTIVALLHDTIITVGVFAVTYREFSLTTLAALLTIIGFSMNDTVVVFDRIREDVAKYRDRRFDRVVNTAVNETLSRTILTSATVFFVTLAMNIFGTGVIREFAFAMNVGVIVGTYSSIFVASPVLIWLNDRYGVKPKSGAERPRRPVRPGQEPETT